MNRLFAWLFLPYITIVIIAASLGKEKSLEIFGSNLLEEYCIVLLLMMVIDIQRIIIKWIKEK
jgi:hypothetical protein|tara:strand:+ start:858 stop:1046 length:189 start_codon:yes stop_codon:yes gene_type:complete